MPRSQTNRLLGILLRNLFLGIYAHIILFEKHDYCWLRVAKSRSKNLAPSARARLGSVGRPPGRSQPLHLFAEATLPCFPISLPTSFAARVPTDACPDKIDCLNPVVSVGTAH